MRRRSWARKFIFGSRRNPFEKPTGTHLDTHAGDRANKSAQISGSVFLPFPARVQQSNNQRKTLPSVIRGCDWPGRSHSRRLDSSPSHTRRNMYVTGNSVGK